MLNCLSALILPALTRCSSMPFVAVIATAEAAA